MKKHKLQFKIFFLTILFCGLFGLVGSSQAGRNISLPFEENLNQNNYSDLVWVTQGATHTWQSSGCWSGGCAKFTPPYGPNQGYSGLGQFTGLSGTQINVRFLIYYGSTIRENSSHYSKLIIINRGVLDRPMIITRNYSQSPWASNPYATIAPCDGTVCKYYGGDYWPDGTDTFRIGNPPQHRESQWICIEIEANTTTGQIKLYIHTQDGVLSGLYQTQTMASTGETWSLIDIIGGYWDVNGVQDSNNYFIIDELKVDSSYIGPPDGFFSAPPDTTPPAAPSGLSVN